MNKFTLLLAALALSLSLSAQTFNENIRNDWPDERYQVHGDGTVTDTVTDLMWMQCSLGQESNDDCSGSTSTYTWEQALEAAENQVFANHSDWRLPNIKELFSLAARDRYDPAINSSIFPNTRDNRYWSASPYANLSSGAWLLDFRSGFDDDDYRSYGYYVRLVRAGK